MWFNDHEPGTSVWPIEESVVSSSPGRVGYKPHVYSAYTITRVTHVPLVEKMHVFKTWINDKGTICLYSPISYFLRSNEPVQQTHIKRVKEMSQK